MSILLVLILVSFIKRLGMHIDYVDFVIRESSLFRATKLCIPRTSLRDFLVWEMHAGVLAGHYGRDLTIVLVKDRFDWPSLSLSKA